MNPVCLYNPLLSPPLSCKTFQKNYLHSLPSLHPHYLVFCPHHFTEQVLPRSLITLTLFSPAAGSPSWSHLIHQQPLTPPSTPPLTPLFLVFLPVVQGPASQFHPVFSPFTLCWCSLFLSLSSGLCFWVPTSRTLQAATAAAKSLQLCPTLCNPRDGSSLGSQGLYRRSHPIPWLCFIRYLFLFFHYLILLMQQHVSDLLMLPCSFLRLCVYHFCLIFFLSVLQIGSFLLIFKFTDFSSVISLLLLRWPCEFLIIDLLVFSSVISIWFFRIVSLCVLGTPNFLLIARTFISGNTAPIVALKSLFGNANIWVKLSHHLLIIFFLGNCSHFPGSLYTE